MYMQVMWSVQTFTVATLWHYLQPAKFIYTEQELKFIWWTVHDNIPGSTRRDWLF